MLHQGVHRHLCGKARSMFEAEVVEISTEQVTMLAVDVIKRQMPWRLCTVPRELSAGPPLDWTSAHATNIHMNWPIACLQQHLGLCTELPDKAVH